MPSLRMGESTFEPLPQSLTVTPQPQPPIATICSSRKYHRFLVLTAQYPQDVDIPVHRRMNGGYTIAYLGG